MENKINIAELLKDCPQGMELDCLLCNNPIELEGVVGNEASYPIRAVGKDGFHHVFTAYGEPYNHDDAKCVIFPKGKTTWEGFVPPCQFKDGDVVTNIQGAVIIYKKITTSGYCGSFVSLDHYNKFIPHYESYLTDTIRLATEEEKEKLFDAIKTNGYKWNAETKTLEKLPTFKVEDKIEKCGYRFTIVEIKDNYYLTKCGNKIPIDNQDDFSLVPNKFDITTLKPFDKVLVRDHNAQEWVASLFSNYNEPKKYKYICVNGSGYAQCIPYEGNEHLLGTTNDCDEYYKTWE